MSYKLVVLLAVFLVYNDRSTLAHSGLQSIFDMCLQQYPVDNGEELWQHFKKNGELPDESNKNAKCHFFCIPNKLGIIDDHGVVDAPKAKEMFLKFHPDFTNPDAVDLVIQECRTDNSGVDVCDGSYEFKKCMMKRYLKAKHGR